jgi:hypothetical protein
VPKYVNGIVSIWQPSISAKNSIFSSSTFMGTIKDLLKFTFNPVEAAKDCRRHLKKNNPLGIVGMIITVSSSYCTIG